MEGFESGSCGAPSPTQEPTGLAQPLTLEVLGLSQEDLANRLVDRLADGLLTDLHYDEDGFEFRGTSPFAKSLNKLVKARLDALVEDLGSKHVLPRVSELVENLVLQETNRWGEPTGKSVTFIEYLVQRAEAYMTEKVNYEGKSKDESGGYSWSGTQTRVAHLIHKHLHYSIETAMKEALANANSAIAKGLLDTVKLKLGEATAALKVAVTTK
ncbi:hypothetical protein LRS10_13550 [Phenylobacterium sp. J426]|uniref:hypothetical protein n=1 Tax=Phenylobacterium sp. J426 TaxID=2898439 RepID=UPI0021519F38|nr:hypothetical protein [Phenylobacterium sp. J426]MCR5875118.1 hypothetical protein [Phenylobacterium sp. J426]